MWKIIFGVAGGILLAGLIGIIIQFWIASSFINAAKEIITPKISKKDIGIKHELLKEVKNFTHTNTGNEKPKIEKQGFEAQYIKPEECKKIRNWETQVKCSNHYIVARENFKM